MTMMMKVTVMVMVIMRVMVMVVMSVMVMVIHLYCLPPGCSWVGK